MKIFENPEIQVNTFKMEDIMTGSVVNPDRNNGNNATPWG